VNTVAGRSCAAHDVEPCRPRTGLPLPWLLLGPEVINTGDADKVDDEIGRLDTAFVLNGASRRCSHGSCTVWSLVMWTM
jgi:hypothetical protein